jgi:hypothetical protein
MAGDPQQLPPTVVSQKALEYGLDVTLFSRMMTAGRVSALTCNAGTACTACDDVACCACGDGPLRGPPGSPAWFSCQQLRHGSYVCWTLMPAGITSLWVLRFRPSVRACAGPST